MDQIASMKRGEEVTISATILEVKRHATSYYGNPQYDIRTDRGSFLTQRDASVGYAATNFQPRYGEKGRKVTLTLRKATKYTYVTHIKEAPEEPEEPASPDTSRDDRASRKERVVELVGRITILAQRNRHTDSMRLIERAVTKLRGELAGLPDDPVITEEVMGTVKQTLIENGVPIRRLGFAR